MPFPVDLTSILTGATTSQLAYWRRTGLLMPEEAQRPAALYSFRDIVALRTVVHLRTETSLQAVRTAFTAMHRFDFTDHPSSYRLVSHGKSIALHRGAETIDLVQAPGQLVLATLADIFEPFTTRSGRPVVDFLHPRPQLEVRERRLGGWPTVLGTRVPFDAVAQLVGDGSVTPEQVTAHYYPSVTAEAVADAVSFADEVADISRSSG